MFRQLLILILSTSVSSAWATEDGLSIESGQEMSWAKFNSLVSKQEDHDQIEGIGYIISGALALAGGIAGSEMAKDSVDRAIYSVFQGIGVASIGFGAYAWTIGGEDRQFHETVSNLNSLSNKEKSQLTTVYLQKKRERRKKDRIIKAATHGMLGALNFYSASTISDKDLKGFFHFVASVHTLAAISFTFEF